MSSDEFMMKHMQSKHLQKSGEAKPMNFYHLTKFTIVEFSGFFCFPGFFTLSAEQQRKLYSEFKELIKKEIKEEKDYWEGH